MVSATTTDSSAPAHIQTYLAAVEDLFNMELRSEPAHVQQLVNRVARFRGKMLRPSLVLLAGLACQESPQPLGRAHVVLATVVEMSHVATLVHDDVLDNAQIRRRGATINHLHGNETAVLLGDLLISHAFYLCSSLESQAASRLIGRTTNIVCEGELMQNFRRCDWNLDESDYFDIIYRKTASLIETACRLGAQESTRDATMIDALARYGRHIGTAFQIIDDVLDITGQPATVGKSLGTDIDKGKLTLPMIHFLATAAQTHRELLIGLLESPEENRVEKVRQLLIPSASIAYARRRAREMVDEAMETIRILPDSPARATLLDMARFITAREL